ncbi:hypothetical protein CPB84DRAFT_1959979 [Gymnopilus junonius]|uniref:Uncharacterized protein n=1 Tax=Gymnopilus junonius TaxID=109634 RepID=A0A9P5TQ36_GYMJU|nr:hypothetical protein CPB84DRAFT_1959979 [Gymnopilus junonius]
MTANKRVAESSSDPYKRRRIDTNARFDNMVDTMSTLHSYPQVHSRQSSNRKTPHRPTRPDHTPHKHPTRSAGSDFSSEKTTRSSSVEKCPSRDSTLSKSLPNWLEKTFMSLARKHPLRLLLPLDMRSPPEENTSNHQPSDPEAVTMSEENLFAYSMPVREPSPHHSPKTFASSSAADPYLISLLGSSVESATAFSAHSLETCSSPTFYADSHADLNSHLFKPHIFDNSSESDHFADVLNTSENVGDITDETAPDSFPPDLVRSSLFSDIYSTPGPGYYISHPMAHFVSPVEDPMSLDRRLGLEIREDELDFQWKTFDRKHIVVPSLARTPTKVKPLRRSINIRGAEPAKITGSTYVAEPPPSPSPFRFSPPLERGTQIQRPDISKVLEHEQRALHISLQPAYGVSASQQIEPTSPRTPIFQHSRSLSGHIDDVELTNTPDNTFLYAYDEGEHEHSQASNDTIESWGNDVRNTWAKES